MTWLALLAQRWCCELDPVEAAENFCEMIVPKLAVSAEHLSEAAKSSASKSNPTTPRSQSRVAKSPSCWPRQAKINFPASSHADQQDRTPNGKWSKSLREDHAANPARTMIPEDGSAPPQLQFMRRGDGSHASQGRMRALEAETGASQRLSAYGETGKWSHQMKRGELAPSEPSSPVKSRWAGLGY